jgi:hypothetical protein
MYNIASVAENFNHPRCGTHGAEMKFPTFARTKSPSHVGKYTVIYHTNGASGHEKLVDLTENSCV